MGLSGVWDGSQDGAPKGGRKLADRRNLSNYDRSLLALKLKPMIAARAKKRMQAGKADPTKKSAEGETRQQLATIAGVSHDTIHKVEKIEAEGSDSLKRQVRRRSSSSLSRSGSHEAGVKKFITRR